MKYLLTPYSVAQVITAIVAIIVSIYAWRRRDSRGGWPIFLLFIAVSELALAEGLESAAVPLELKIFWSKISYIGAQTAPPLLLLFALQYTGQGKKATPLTTGLLFVIPAIIIFLAGTNNVHGLIWVNFLPGPPGTNSLIYQHGPAFWVAVAYIFSVVVFANALLFIYTIRTKKIFRQQGLLITLASFLPWIGAVLYVLGLNPFPGLDIVSISFFFNGLLILLGINRSQLMNLVPIASEFIFENLSNAIIVVDDRKRLIDYNPLFLNIDPKLEASNELIGLPVDQVIDFWDQLADMFDIDESNQKEIQYQGKYYSVRTSPIVDHFHRFVGWSIVFEDISREKQVGLELGKANRQLQSQLDDINLLQDQLQQLVVRDSLTGVYNRRYLDETLSREIAHASRSGYPLSLIMMDVDHFKKVNDNYGHKMGDEVIAAIGQFLQSQTRNSDCVSRYGGDEFLLVMPEMTNENAYERAEVWREGIRSMIFQTGNEIFQVTISIGISSFPRNGKDVDRLVKAADDALYQAKDEGRDRTRIFY